MAVNTAAAIAMIYAPGRGLRWMTRSGLMHQWKRNDAGVRYPGDAGWPTSWSVDLASMDGLHQRIVGFGLKVSNVYEYASPVVDAYPITLTVETDGGAQGRTITTFSKPSSKANAATPVPEKFWQIPYSTLGGFRHDVSISSQNSAQTVERFLVEMDVPAGAKGN